MEAFCDSVSEQLSYGIGIGGTEARAADVDSLSLFLSIFGFTLNERR